MSAKAKSKLTPEQQKATMTRVLQKIKPYGFFVVGLPCQNVFSGEVFIAVFQMVHADCHISAAFQIGTSVFYFFCFPRYFPILI